MEEKKGKKPKIPRNKEKFPALNAKRAVFNRRDLLQVDYLDKLNDREKDWLNRFNEEFVIANFNHKGRSLDKTKKAKKAAYDSNNARNRCLYNKAKSTGMLDNVPSQDYFNSKLKDISIDTYEHIEDVLIRRIDESKEIKEELTKIVKKNKEILKLRKDLKKT